MSDNPSENHFYNQSTNNPSNNINSNQDIPPPPSSNPYAAPSGMDDTSILGSATGEFYVVSERKLTILTVGTAGIYVLYWFWKHWKLIKDAEESDIWPIPRAIFSIFFTHKLFEKIETSAAEYDTGLPALKGFATMFVVVQVVNQIFSSVSDSGLLLLILSVAYVIFDSYILNQAQKQANIASGDAEGASNDDLTAVNYVFIVIGILFWLLMLAGVFMA